MNLSRRAFQALLAAAALCPDADAHEPPPFGSVSLLHLTDCHAQLLPAWVRDPADGPDDVYERMARGQGRVGGFAHLATLVKRLKASRPGALLLDGGDSWQGSATALWTEGRDMIAACRQLGVDVMTGHWEFTLGMDRVRQAVAHELGDIAFVAHNVATRDFEDAVFEPAVMREVNRVPVCIIGQAYPYTPIAHPRRFVPDWSFGIREEALQRRIDAARQAGARIVVLLSHNGLDIDLKLAGRVRGLDAILGGHTHDPLPRAVPVRNAGGITLVTNAGSHGRFLGVMDIDARRGRAIDIRYRLLPVFADKLPADRDMQALIERVRRPWQAELQRPIATTEGLLWRRGTYNGSWDQLICDALREVLGAEIALSPGFRWGTALLPGETVTRESLMEQLALSYPQTTVAEMTGAELKARLEDVADNCFHPDSYYRQGGDMVRTGGLRWRIAPGGRMGRWIDDLRIGDSPIDPAKTYRVAGWAPMADAPQGPPVWDVVETWLKARGGRVPAIRPDAPTATSATASGCDRTPRA